MGAPIVVGGTPIALIDDPICVVLLILFGICALAHLSVLLENKEKKSQTPGRPRFAFSGMLCVMCALRCAALAVRIAWASLSSSPPLEIEQEEATAASTSGLATAATAIAQLGTVLIFLTNLVLAQRVLRGYRPELGWRRGTDRAFQGLLGAVIAALVVMVGAGVALGCYSSSSASLAASHAARITQLVGAVGLAVLASVPVFVVLGAAVAIQVARSAKVRLLLLCSALAALGAWFRAGTGIAIATRVLAANANTDASTTDLSQQEQQQTPWYAARWCYYIFNYATDLAVAAAYLYWNFDRRFVVPDGWWAPPPPPNTNANANNDNKRSRTKIRKTQSTGQFISLDCLIRNRKHGARNTTRTAASDPADNKSTGVVMMGSQDIADDTSRSGSAVPFLSGPSPLPPPSSSDSPSPRLSPSSTSRGFASRMTMMTTMEVDSVSVLGLDSSGDTNNSNNNTNDESTYPGYAIPPTFLEMGSSNDDCDYNDIVMADYYSQQQQHHHPDHSS